MVDFGERPKFLTSNASVEIASTPVVRSELQNHHRALSMCVLSCVNSRLPVYLHKEGYEILY